MKNFTLALQLIILVAQWLCAAPARAEWSPQIVIYNFPTNVEGPTEAAMGVDSFGGVHIVHPFHYRIPDSNYVWTGLLYQKYNEHGQRMVGPTFLTDTLDEEIFHPQIGFFGTDSLMIMWYWDRDTYEDRCDIRSMSLSLSGNVLGPHHTWVRQVSSVDFTFNCRHGGKMALAYKLSWAEMHVTAVEPGSMPLNQILVWNQTPTWDAVRGFIDHTDSLQLIWRQRCVTYDGLYVKRISVTAPFDSTQITEHLSLTPEVDGQWPGDPLLSPIGDSLLLFQEAHPGGTWGMYSLHVLRRDTYEVVSTSGEISPLRIYGAVEGDSIVSYCYDSSNYDLHYARRHLPDLMLIQDTVLIAASGSTAHAGVVGFAVSATGVHYVLYIQGTNVAGQGTLSFRMDGPYLESRNRPLPAAMKLDYKVFPNPTNGSFTLEGPLQRVISLTICNILGQTVAVYPQIAEHPGEGQINLPVDALPTGTYFIKLNTHDGVIVRRLLLVR
jgi:hypothetical protein